MECYPIRCDCTSTLTAKWCEPTSNAMPHAWFSLDILTTLVHIFSRLHDRNFFWGMLSTRCLGKTLDIVLTPLYSTHQVQHQKKLAEYGPYNSILVDGKQRQIPFTLSDLSGPSRPGYEHCCGVVGTMLKGANMAVKLHNSNLDNSLPTTVQASVVDFLTSSEQHGASRRGSERTWGFTSSPRGKAK